VRKEPFWAGDWKPGSDGGSGRCGGDIALLPVPTGCPAAESVYQALVEGEVLQEWAGIWGHFELC